MEKEITAKLIEESKIIVILRAIEEEKLEKIITSLYGAGIRCVEITFDSKKTVEDKTVGKEISNLSKKFPDMAIGVGSVLNQEQVELAKDSGASFIVSPNTNENVIKKTVELNLVSIAGAFTPTEIQNAVVYGANFVKFFPYDGIKPKYVKAIVKPLSHVKLLGFSGVTVSNIKSGLKNGIVGFGVGNGIVKKSLIEKENYKKIEKLAKKYLKAVKS